MALSKAGKSFKKVSGPPKASASLSFNARLIFVSQYCGTVTSESMIIKKSPLGNLKRRWLVPDSGTIPNQLNR